MGAEVASSSVRLTAERPSPIMLAQPPLADGVHVCAAFHGLVAAGSVLSEGCRMALHGRCPRESVAESYDYIGGYPENAGSIPRAAGEALRRGDAAWVGLVRPGVRHRRA